MSKRKDITPRNDKGQYHGYCKLYWSNGVLQYEGNATNDKEDALWKDYDKDGELECKWYYLI